MHKAPHALAAGTPVRILKQQVALSVADVPALLIHALAGELAWVEGCCGPDAYEVRCQSGGQPFRMVASDLEVIAA